MEFSWQVDLGNVLTIVITAVGVIGGWYDLRNKALNNAAAAERAQRAAENADTKALAAHQHSATVLALLNDYREKVASEYVTVSALNVIRGDIHSNFARLSERLDRMFERRGE